MKDDKLKDWDPFETSSRVMELLADFDVLGGQTLALVRWDAPPEVKKRVLGAVLSWDLGLTSVDHTRRAYVSRKVRVARKELYDLQHELYEECHGHLEATFSRLDPSKGTPPVGCLAASVTLERLRSSFFSAHLLYRLGRTFEGHCVARLVLEQIAWAYAVREVNRVEQLERIAPQRAVTQLRTVVPGAGRLYGYLSEHTHLGYEMHRRFLDTRSRPYKIICADREQSIREGIVLLQLADYCGVVYELTQADFMERLVNTQSIEGILTINEDRPFASIVSELSAKIRAACDIA